MAKKVLIVDDSVLMRTIITDIMKADSDFQVVAAASNGQIALTEAQKHKPDVILLDIEMPVMDGIECLKRLKLVSTAKVVILSSVAQAGSPQAMEARRLGAFDVIAKPSGAVSLDLRAKKGHDILKVVRRAVGLPAV